MSATLQAITMPKWGLAMDEGMVVAWHVEEGARIDGSEEILDIETTKITNALESTAAGVLCRRVAAEGETLPVGALLAVIAEESVEADEVDTFIANFNENFAVAAAEAATQSPSEPEMVEAAGWRLNYLRTGEGEGPPIVLVHGFGGDLNNWMFNQPDLAQGHCVYALDLPGHGRSTKDVGAGDLGVLSEALGAFLDALGIGPAHLVGHSLGGAVVLDLALRCPEAAASLTLISSAGLGPEIDGDYIEGFIAAGRRKEMKTVLALLFAAPGTVSRDMVEEVLRYKRLDGVDEALRAIAEAVFPGGRQGSVLAGRFAELTLPVQVIHGREDRIVPPTHAEGLPAKVAVAMIENAGHMPQMEAAAEVNRLIREIAV